MTPFWIVGIVLNLVLVGLGVWWVLANMAPRDKSHLPSPTPVDGNAFPLPAGHLVEDNRDGHHAKN
jgi:hypothetical protein